MLAMSISLLKLICHHRPPFAIVPSFFRVRLALKRDLAG